MHRELQLLVRAGLTPLAVGMEADLLLLRADPLRDITNTRAIALVVKRGVCFDPAELVVP